MLSVAADHATPEATRRRVVIHCGDLSNVGDMALLLRGARMLRAHKLATTITVFAWAPPTPEVIDVLERNGIQIASAKNIVRSLWMSRGALYVIGGGQMVRPNASFKATLLLLARVMVARLTGGVAIAHGLGVSAIADRRLALLWTRILSLCSYVAVRDSGSAENVRRSFALSAQVTADLMLSELADAPRNRAARDLILVVPCDDRGEGRWFSSENVAALIKRSLAALPAARLTFLAHDIRQGMDPQAIERTIALLNLPETQYDVVATVDVDKARRLYDRSALTITNRLHSVIFSAAARAPVIAVSDGGSKTAELGRMLGVTEFDPTKGPSDREMDALVDAARQHVYPAQMMSEIASRSERNGMLLAQVS